METTIRPAIHGLEIYNAPKCPHCPRLYGKSTVLSKHFAKDHSTSEIPTSFQTVPGQRFNNATSKRYFQVIPPPPQLFIPGHTTNILSGLRKQIQDDWNTQDSETTYDPHDPRVVTPWLKTTGWHQHILPYQTADLRELVAQPGKEEWVGLKAAVHKLLYHAMSLISVMPELSLLRLNSPDPVKQ